MAQGPGSSPLRSEVAGALDHSDISVPLHGGPNPGPLESSHEGAAQEAASIAQSTADPALDGHRGVPSEALLQQQQQQHGAPSTSTVQQPVPPAGASSAAPAADPVPSARTLPSPSAEHEQEQVRAGWARSQLVELLVAER